MNFSNSAPQGPAWVFAILNLLFTFLFCFVLWTQAFVRSLLTTQVGLPSGKVELFLVPVNSPIRPRGNNVSSSLPTQKAAHVEDAGRFRKWPTVPGRKSGERLVSDEGTGSLLSYYRSLMSCCFSFVNHSISSLFGSFFSGLTAGWLRAGG